MLAALLATALAGVDSGGGSGGGASDAQTFWAAEISNFNPQQTFFVSPDGIDSAGRDGSQSQPFATIDYAILRTSASSVNGARTLVVVADGEYTLSAQEATVPAGNGYSGGGLRIGLRNMCFICSPGKVTLNCLPGAARDAAAYVCQNANSRVCGFIFKTNPGARVSGYDNAFFSGGGTSCEGILRNCAFYSAGAGCLHYVSVVNNNLQLYSCSFNSASTATANYSGQPGVMTNCAVKTGFSTTAGITSTGNKTGIAFDVNWHATVAAGGAAQDHLAGVWYGAYSWDGQGGATVQPPPLVVGAQWEEVYTYYRTYIDTFSAVAFVSATTGVDAPGSGTQAQPYATLNYATTDIGSDTAILIANGTYSAASGVDVVDGYSGGGLRPGNKKLGYFGKPGAVTVNCDPTSARDAHAWVGYASGSGAWGLTFSVNTGARASGHDNSFFGSGTAAVRGDFYNCVFTADSRASCFYDNSNARAVNAYNCSFNCTGTPMANYTGAFGILSACAFKTGFSLTSSSSPVTNIDGQQFDATWHSSNVSNGASNDATNGVWSGSKPWY